MGTSNPFGGQGSGKPLVPSWMGDDGISPSDPVSTEPDGQPAEEPAPPSDIPMPPPYRPIPTVVDPNRFSSARYNFSRFASSGGTDRKSLGRAVSRYVRSSAESAGIAARMGSSRGAGSRLLNFLSDVTANGGTAALRAMNLSVLAGRPIEEIFLGLVDYICPDGGSVDEGIAREAFIETIADLAEAGVTDLDSLTTDQMQTVFEIYATNAIEARLCNDIGMNLITFPASNREVAQVQAQLHDFIQRAVADALTIASASTATLTPDRVLEFVEGIYKQAFIILKVMGDTEAR